MQISCDFLVIGSGLAGLAFALKTAERGKVIILSKASAPSANTAWAQGGIAAVMAKSDSFESHVQDTLVAGAGLCHEDVVRAVVESAPERIQDLIDWGICFDLERSADGTLGQVSLTREGGHSHRRILHVQDHTGQEIHQALLQRVRQHPNIDLRENQFAVDLILNRDLAPFRMDRPRCLGAYASDRARMEEDEPTAYLARMTMLATGGAGKTYLYTSNWSGATGDGIAMAFRAGCRVANLEFMQFHPTCLYHPSARNFLITEAMRGEGGELVNAEGEPFARKYHALGSLAPRDIVARSIDAEMKRSGANCVYLDVTGKPEAFLRERFPVIFAKCREYGTDIAREPIPVVPAAHYLCGGVVADIDGRTDVECLLAAGETTCTGLHGANRLASNSLLECLVASNNAARVAIEAMGEIPVPRATPSDLPRATRQTEDEMILISHVWEEIRRLMWNYVGIVRSNRRLWRAKKRLDAIQLEIQDAYGSFPGHPDIMELRNIALVADLTVRCALARKESRGIHFSLDYPEAPASAAAADTILRPG
jgi:L-aspartate oxidase